MPQRQGTGAAEAAILPLGPGWSGRCCRRRQLVVMVHEFRVVLGLGRRGSPGCAWLRDRQVLAGLRRRLVSNGLTQKTRNVPDWVPVVLTIWLMWRRYWAPSCAVDLGILAAFVVGRRRRWTAGWAARASGGD